VHLRLRLRHDLERHRRGRWHQRRRGGLKRLHQRWQRLCATWQKPWRPWVGVLAATAAVASALVAVGHRAHAESFAPGTHFEGRPLAAEHPAHAALAPSQADSQAAPGMSAPPLALRTGCRWGLPGRNPYRGDVEAALAAGGVPADAVRVIAAQVRNGVVAERLTIANDGIRGVSSGRVFDAKKVALSFGRTMCLDAQVNFPAGHSEPASLFEATDAEGRRHAAMVPDVCGNVSVLSDAAEAGEDGRAAAQAGTGTGSGEGRGGVVSGSGANAGTNAVPLPATLWQVLLGLGLIGLLGRRR
jgi:hypothetical protein